MILYFCDFIARNVILLQSNLLIKPSSSECPSMNMIGMFRCMCARECECFRGIHCNSSAERLSETAKKANWIKRNTFILLDVIALRVDSVDFIYSGRGGRCCCRRRRRRHRRMFPAFIVKNEHVHSVCDRFRLKSFRVLFCLRFACVLRVFQLAVSWIC